MGYTGSIYGWYRNCIEITLALQQAPRSGLPETSVVGGSLALRHRF